MMSTMTPGMTGSRRAAREQQKVNLGDNATVGRNRGGRNNRMTKEKLVPLLTPLYKTRLCNPYFAGACKKGSSCSYAHGEEDLRPSPDFERTSVCPIMLNHGQCDKLNCRYAHNANELRTAPGLLKTRMCSFHARGLCVVGQACRFAHSQDELEEALEVQKEAALPFTNTSPPRPNAELREMQGTAFVLPRSKSEAMENYILPLEHDKLQVLPTIVHDAPPGFDDADDIHHADKAAGVSPKLREQQVPMFSLLDRAEAERGQVEAEAPAQVVRGKVTVDIEDDDTPVPMLAPMGTRVVVEVEDVSATCKYYMGEECPCSAGPLMVEFRRRGHSDGCTTIARLAVTPMGVTLMTNRRRENRCINPKDKSASCTAAGHFAECAMKSASCTAAGHFAECAMCKRTKGQTLQSGCSNHETQRRGGCAACSCGLKVVSRNSFLTVLGSEGYGADEEKPDVRRRAWSA